MEAAESKTKPASKETSYSGSGKDERQAFFDYTNKKDSLFFAPAIQPKLAVGHPDDEYEQEADHVADAVMRVPDPQVQRQPVEEEEELQMKQQGPKIQRKCQECEEEDKLQKKSDGNAPSANHANSEISSQLTSSAGRGSRLPNAIQSEMSHKIGADFSGVNIHTDATSHKLNRQLRAKAFTHGSDIYFNKGEYKPASSEGKHLLAHELTHVRQQQTDDRLPAVQRDPDDPPTMVRNVRPSPWERRSRRSDQLRSLNQRSRERMEEIMRTWHQGTLIFNFSWGNGTEVRDSVPTWITAGTHVTRTDDLSVVMDQIFELSVYFVDDKLNRLREAILPGSSLLFDLNQEIDNWIRVQHLADTASSEEEMSNAYQWFLIENENVVEIIHRHYPEVEQEAREGEPELSEAQIAAINRLAEQMPYDELERGYLALNQWLEDQPWLGTIKSSIANTDTIVDAAFESGVYQASSAIRESLKLMSKLIGNKGDIDKIFLLATASEHVEGEENKERIAAFISYWSQYGWNDLMDFYRSFRSDDQPAYSSVTADRFVTLDTQNQVTIALNVGRALQVDDLVTFRVLAASIRDTLSIIGELAWWGLEKAFLSRIPSWALIKLSFSGVSEAIDLLRDMSGDNEEGS